MGQPLCAKPSSHPPPNPAMTRRPLDVAGGQVQTPRAAVKRPGSGREGLGGPLAPRRSREHLPGWLTRPTPAGGYSGWWAGTHRTVLKIKQK